MAQKLSPLEEELVNEWDQLAFAWYRNGQSPMSREDLYKEAVAEQHRWDALLDKAFSGTEWAVSPTVAATISGSRWHNAMVRYDYQGAATEIERCLQHPRGHARSDQAELPIKLFVAQLAWRDGPEAAANLHSHLHSGIYSRGTMALFIASTLHALANDIDQTRFLPEGLAELGAAISFTKRMAKRARELQTWGELNRFLRDWFDERARKRRRADAS